MTPTTAGALSMILSNIFATIRMAARCCCCWLIRGRQSPLLKKVCKAEEAAGAMRPLVGSRGRGRRPGAAAKAPSPRRSSGWPPNFRPLLATRYPRWLAASIWSWSRKTTFLYYYFILLEWQQMKAKRAHNKLHYLYRRCC